MSGMAATLEFPDSKIPAQLNGKAVYSVIAAVSRTLAVTGIGKTRKNDQQGYSFRGIDEVLNALSPALTEAGLVILPRMTERTVTERVTAKGGVLFYTVVRAEFDFVAVSDGSVHTVVTYGEAMDSGDKSTNKAMSAAYKYAAFQTFCIPLEGMGADADTTTHDVIPTIPAGYDDWMDDLRAVAVEGMVALRKAWKESPDVRRDYATKHDAEKWGKVKAAADEADKKAKS